MKNLRHWWSKLKGLLFRRADSVFDSEIQEHLNLLIQHFRAQGMSEADAVHAARLQFGNITHLKEVRRGQQSFLQPVEWARDLRFGLRMLRKQPGTNAAVILALSLGIGMNAAIFSFVNALLLRPPQGLPSPGTLSEVWLHNHSGSGIQSYFPFDYPDYIYFRDHSHSLGGLLAFDGDGHEVIWNRAGKGQIIQGQLVSGNFFSIAGVSPILGRAISPDDDQVDTPRHVVVLNHSFWKTQLSADRSIIGKQLVLNGAAFTVIGVAPAGFSGLIVGTPPDFWTSIANTFLLTHDKDRLSNPDSYWLFVAGRAIPGIPHVRVDAEMQLLASQAAKHHPENSAPLEALVYPATFVPGPFREYVAAFTGLLLAVFLLVLLIACTNAAGLLLARSVSRAREMAIRSALGARRGRLLRQLLLESLLLSCIAGVAAVVIASGGIRMLLLLKPSSLPISFDVPLDWRVLLFTLAVSVATGLIFGIVPALRASRVDPAPVLKEEAQTAGPRRSRLRTALLMGEIATCVVLLSAAALCVRSLMHASSIDPGFDTHHVAVATLDPGSLGYSAEKTASFYTSLLDRVRALPGVTSAGYADHLPLGTSRSETSAQLTPGKNPAQIRTDVFHIESGYFNTMSIPVLSGRDFTPKESNDPRSGVVIVNQFLANRLWPAQDPIGKRIYIGDDKTSSEVIGVVKSGKYRTLGESPVAVIYRGGLPPQRTLVIRTSGDPRMLIDEIRTQVQLVDPLMAATNLQTMQEFMALPMFPARATGIMLGFSGIIALVLTTIGLFGVIAYSVSQRTHEIGVRIALGARRSDVFRLIMRQGLRLAAVGLFIGLAAACFAVRLLSPLLYGIGANDPLTLGFVCLALAVVTLLACYIPARRAVQIDPAAALRYE